MKISFRHGWAMLSAAVLSLTALPLSAVSSVTSLSAAAAAAPVVENLDRGNQKRQWHIGQLAVSCERPDWNGIPALSR